MKVPDEKLRSVLGITNVHYVAQKHSLAVGGFATCQFLSPDSKDNS